MKQMLILSCFLFGCADLISVFYDTQAFKDRSTDSIDLNLQTMTDLRLNQSIDHLDRSISAFGDMLGENQVDMWLNMMDGSNPLNDLLITDHHLSKDAMMIDQRVCQADFKLKIGDQLLVLNDVNHCLLDLDYRYLEDQVPRINSGIFKFDMTDDPNLECNLIFSVTALSCGIEKVYQIGSTLNLRNCAGLDRRFQDSYQIIQNDGLIVSFTEINTGGQTGDFSDQPFTTSLSGHIGTTLINGILVNHHRGDLVPIKLYGDFSISKTQISSPSSDIYECHQLNDMPTFDMDGDGEAIYVYGEDYQDCNDQNPMANSMHTERCYPCGMNCPEMILISRGSFMMGSDPSNSGEFVNANEYNNHLVHISHDFYVSKSEITVGQFRSCVNQVQCDDPGRFHTQGTGCNWTNPAENLEDHPINCITWENARKYAKWVNADLLSEAQWEYLAVGAGQLPLGQESIYPWGNDEPNCDFANFIFNNTYCITGNGGLNFNGHLPTYTKPICSTLRGNTPQGVCDMSGNVMEWVLDEWHHGYDQIPIDGSDLAWCDDFGTCQTNTGALRVVRGGAWNDRTYELRSSSRHPESPFNNDDRIGFRIARASQSIFR